MRAVVAVRLSAGLGFSRYGAMWSSLALVCALLAGCVGGSPPPLAADQAAPPIADPARAQAANSQPVVWTPAPIAADPVLLQRRRQLIADLVEGYPDYRTIVWVNLLNARLAGPFEWGKRTIYCVSAQLWSAIGSTPTMVVQVQRSGDGSERLIAATGGLFECTGADYGPFPELEEARAKRRKRLGLDA
jgi:hypothetical protein